MVCSGKLVLQASWLGGHWLILASKLSDTGAPTLQALSAPSSVGFRPQTIVDEDIVDVKQIDKVLSELAAMSGRWNLFRKFLFDRLSVICPLPPPRTISPGNPIYRMTILIQNLERAPHIR